MPSWKSTWVATSNPTNSDNLNIGYDVSSYWINKNTGNVFFCTSSTVSSATWVLLTEYPYIMKSSNTTITNSATLVDVSDLQFTMVANKTYKVKLMVLYHNNATALAGLRYSLVLPSVPAGVTNFKGTGLINPAGTTTVSAFNVSATDNAVTNGIAVASANPGLLNIEANVRCGTTGGLCKFRAAQSAANALSTVILANSIIEYKQLN